MHRPQSDEAETMFQAPGEPELDFPTQTIPEGVYDTLILAQTLLHIAAFSPSLPTPESLSMAVAVFQAATKLQSPPVYEKDDRDDIIEKLQGRLESIEKASGNITLSARLDGALQTVRFDTTAQVFEAEGRKCSAMFEDLSSGIESIEKEVKSLMVVVDTVELEEVTRSEKKQNTELKNVMVEGEWMQVGGDEIPQRLSKENVDPTVDGRNVTSDSSANETIPNTRGTASVGKSTDGAAHQRTIPSATFFQDICASSCVSEAGMSGTVSGGVPSGSGMANKVKEDETKVNRCSKCKEREQKEKIEEEKKTRRAEGKAIRKAEMQRKRAEEEKKKAEEKIKETEEKKAEEKKAK